MSCFSMEAGTVYIGYFSRRSIPERQKLIYCIYIFNAATFVRMVVPTNKY